MLAEFECSATPCRFQALEGVVDTTTREHALRGIRVSVTKNDGEGRPRRGRERAESKGNFAARSRLGSNANNC
jgi:hypothetical protein